MTPLLPSVNFCVVQPSSDPDASVQCEASGCTKQTDGGFAHKDRGVVLIYLCAKHIRAVVEAK